MRAKEGDDVRFHLEATDSLGYLYRMFVHQWREQNGAMAEAVDASEYIYDPNGVQIFPKSNQKREIEIMARKSTKENKNIYQRTREGLGLTREEASDLLVTMSPERIEKIESKRSMPHPDEVLLMSDQYKHPSLCNYYCANQCPIGQQYVPEIKVKDLSQIILETIASLNAMQRQKERLIEITVDGQISGDELADFVHIQEELEKISIAVETLQLWCERMLDTGAIDQAQYEAYKKSKQ